MKRKPRRTLAAALTACAGIGGALEATGRTVLYALLARRTRAEVARDLGVTERTVRRMVNAYEPKHQHPPVRWCSCEPCREARAA